MYLQLRGFERDQCFKSKNTHVNNYYIIEYYFALQKCVIFLYCFVIGLVCS